MMWTFSTYHMKRWIHAISSLTLLLLNTTCHVLANSVDPDQLASELFVIKYVNFYQKPRSSSLIDWKLEVGVVIYSARQGLNT